MTTSGSTTWSMTARDLAVKAMKELAILSAGEEPEASELDDIIGSLNGLLHSWQMRGVALGNSAQDTITVDADSPTATLPDGVRAISTARVINSATSERPIFPASRTDYLSLPNKAARGSPSMFYEDRQNAASVLYVWPVPTTDTTLAIDFDRLIETVTDASETVDIRQEYQETVWTNLALRIAGMFGPTAAPSPELVARAQRLELQMLDADRPDEYNSWYEGGW